MVWYLVWRVRQEGGIPAKTRLVKLMYLVDLEFARASGAPATSFTWRYYHYGPYPSAIEQVLDRQENRTIASAEVETFFGERAVTYRPLGDPPDDLLPSRLSRMCDRVCSRWAVADLNELLNYVYFETPPMRHARRGDVLDLLADREEPWPPYYRALDRPDIGEDLRRRLAEWERRFDESFPTTPLDPPPRHDEDYERVVRDELESVDLGAQQIHRALRFEIAPQDEP